MVTPNLLVMAINQAGCDCVGECIHSKAMNQLQAALDHAILTYAQDSLMQQKDPLKETFSYGLHVGYQLAHLERDHVQEN